MKQLMTFQFDGLKDLTTWLLGALAIPSHAKHVNREDAFVLISWISMSSSRDAFFSHRRQNQEKMHWY